MDARVIEALSRGKIGVAPTDTLYGLVASAFDREAVERVYAVKGRTPTKPVIILIASIDDLARFGIALSGQERSAIERFWPGPVSVILECADDRFAYLHRGAKTLALRMPDKKDLLGLLVRTGPIIAPSANPEGLTPARTIGEARAYFGDKADFYIDGGTLVGEPSTLIALHEDGLFSVLRQGAKAITSCDNNETVMSE